MKYDKNQVHYVTATAILVKDGKFLIVKRADWEKAFPGKWTVPGGKLEVLDYALRNKDTSAHWYNVVEDLVKKEVEEEVGLGIKNLGYVTSLVYVRSDNIPSLIVSLWGEPVGDEIKLCSALTEFKWVSLEDAKECDLIEGIYEELEILEKKLKTGNMGRWGN
ncbi:NUDIX domain-containing protein [archaeon]|jgi:8-oxo-dGTP pyrophosphatase MutT (NUDIX family)|nr:NUDIX domain-containing protein [archaeon]MBT4373810.1 NUDIX domain-containing protein [archaeon]MBT4532276.1 NUDIX domain-containing protein [archaeon]MBT7001101.1 NUDIX domain-containing protein [archaeon]MBT7281990.1 NUDIX domain-containing protein [archaeon]